MPKSSDYQRLWLTSPKLAFTLLKHMEIFLKKLERVEKKRNEGQLMLRKKEMDRRKWYWPRFWTSHGSRMLSATVTRIVWLELVKCGTAAGWPMAGLAPTTVSIGTKLGRWIFHWINWIINSLNNKYNPIPLFSCWKDDQHSFEQPLVWNHT